MDPISSLEKSFKLDWLYPNFGASVFFPDLFVLVIFIFVLFEGYIEQSFVLELKLSKLLIFFVNSVSLSSSLKKHDFGLNWTELSILKYSNIWHKNLPKYSFSTVHIFNRLSNDWEKNHFLTFFFKFFISFLLSLFFS